MTLFSNKFFGWYFLVCGVLLFGYALFPFFPSLTWQVGLVNDRVTAQARSSASRQELTNAFSDLDVLVGRLPSNENVFKSYWIESAKDPFQKSIKKPESQVAQVIIEKPFVPAVKIASQAKSSSGIRSIAEAIVRPAEAKMIESSGSGSKLEERPIPKDNRLVIPSIKMDGPIVQGDEKALNHGIWLLPGTALPGSGNTALSAHRQRLFYHLDKVKVGDIIIVYWQGKELRYRVEKTFIVNPNDTSILNKTSDSRLVLITCEPLVAMTHRIVVEAVQVR